MIPTALPTFPTLWAFHGKDFLFCCAPLLPPCLCCPLLHLPVITALGLYSVLNSDPFWTNSMQVGKHSSKALWPATPNTCAGCSCECSCELPNTFSSSALPFFFWLELCLQQHLIWAERFPFYMSRQLWRAAQGTEMWLLPEWNFCAFSYIFQRECMSYWKYQFLGVSREWTHIKPRAAFNTYRMH